MGVRTCSDICPQTLHAPRGEQVMFKDKHLTIFSRQTGATVFIMLQIAFAVAYSVT